MNNIEYIRKRQYYLKNKPNDISLSLHENNVCNNNDTHSMQILIKNWKRLGYDEECSLDKLLNIITSKFTNNKMILNSFKENCIPTILNIKKGKQLCKKYNMNNNIINECNKYIIADRIYNNHNSLNRRFNIDEFTYKFNPNNINIDEYVNEVCNKICSIKTRPDIKYVVALENTMYSLYNNGININKNILFESINDYFNINNIPLSMEDIYNVIQESNIYPESILLEFNTEKMLHNIDKSTPSYIKKIINKAYSKSANNIIEETPNYFTWIRKALVFSTVAYQPFIGIPAFIVDKFVETTVKRDQSKRMLKRFKNEIDKVEKLINNTKSEDLKKKYKDYLDKLNNDYDKLEDYDYNLYSSKEHDDELNQYTESANDIDSYIDKFVATVNKQCKNINGKEYFEKCENVKFVAELNNVYIQLLKLLQNPRYAKYANNRVIIANDNKSILKACDDIYNPAKIYSYMINGNITVDIGFCLPLNYTNNISNEDRMNLYIKCKELADQIYCTKMYYDIIIDNSCADMFRICLVDLRIIIPHSYAVEKQIVDDVNYISYMENCLDKINNFKVKNLTNIIKFDKGELIPLIKLSKMYPEIVDPNTFTDYLKDAKNNNKDASPIMINNINEAIYDLNHSNIKHNDFKDRFEILFEYSNIYNILSLVEDINDKYSNNNILSETSFVNTLKITRDRLMTSVKNLSDKEKSISKQIDYNMEKVSKNAEMALSNNNREAVIKGSLLPSASKVIKMGILSAAAYAINPALAIIGVIGTIGVSKVLKKKEKQLILDEIEIELKMVEKKMQLAESNNDMKSLQQLMRIEKKLKRERQRILYNLKVYYQTDIKED